MSVLAREVVGEFAHVKRADQNAARSLQTRDHCCVRLGRRAVAVDLGASSRRQSFDVEQVLHSERRAGKRAQALSARAGLVDRVCLGERAPHGHVGEGAKRAISSFDAIERLLDDLAGAHSALPDRCGDRLSRSVKEARRSCCEDRRRLLLIVERNRKKLLGLLRRDPQMHNRLSAGFRRQRQTKQRRHRVHCGFRIERFVVTQSPRRMRSEAERRGRRYFSGVALSRVIVRKAESCRHHASSISGRSYRRSSSLSSNHQAPSPLSAISASSFGAAPKC